MCKIVNINPGKLIQCFVKLEMRGEQRERERDWHALEQQSSDYDLGESLNLSKKRQSTLRGWFLIRVLIMI